MTVRNQEVAHSSGVGSVGISSDESYLLQPLYAFNVSFITSCKEKVLPPTTNLFFFKTKCGLEAQF